MAPSNDSSRPLVPEFLYSSKSLFNVDALMKKNNHGSPSTMSRQFMIPSPKEKIELFSPEYFAACGIGGLLCTGPTHMAVTPLDVVKCNMQV